MEDSARLIAAIVSILAGLLAAIFYVEKRITSKVVAPGTLKRIAALIRPFAIFTDKEQIVLDRGAMHYIESIEVRHDSNGLPSKILVHPKQALSVAPILTPLDTDGMSITENRGRNFDWEYKIEYEHYNDRDVRKFSIEVIH
jgi:hypothetical protein